MAVTASRTLAKVKSSAISPRQPEVPNLMGEEFGEGSMAMYSSPVIDKRKWTTIDRGRREGNEMPDRQCRVVLVTCGTLAEAKRIPRAALEDRLSGFGHMVAHPP